MKNRRLFILITNAVIFFTVLLSQSIDAISHEWKSHENALKNGCSTDDNCEDNELCKNEKCIHACNTIACGNNTWCHVKNHRPICDCLIRYTGDPYITGCTYMGCNTNTDCEYFLKCENNECISVCESHLCGVNAKCYNKNQKPVCFCDDGYSGYPETGCERRICEVNKHCSVWDRCVNEICQPICPWFWCDDEATCSVVYGHPVCSCNNGTIVGSSGSCK